jgi:hypothetical protein
MESRSGDLLASAFLFHCSSDFWMPPLVNENCMSMHNAENKGANPRDQAQPRRPFWKHAHRDWRIWCAVALMLALICVYVMTDGLSRFPGRRPTQPMPENNAT